MMPTFNFFPGIRVNANHHPDGATRLLVSPIARFVTPDSLYLMRPDAAFSQLVLIGMVPFEAYRCRWMAHLLGLL
jgi:hypothetical protein